MESNKKGLHRYIRSKSKTRELVGLMLNGAGDLKTKNIKMARILMSSLLLSLQVKPPFQNPKPLRPVGKSVTRKTSPHWDQVS